MSEVFSAYSIKLINSLLLAVVFLGIYLITKFLLTRKIKIKRARSKVSIRLRYGFFIFFMIFFIKIWVEGFVQILAFIGFLSAAITITQKDNLMNLVGWLIINWRGLFSEEDFIKISNYGGYVRSIGVLYFTLEEANPDFPDVSSGRIIKIPNGMVARNPVINFSHEKFSEFTLNFIFKPKGSFDAIEVLFLVLKQEILRYLKLQTKFYTQDPDKNDISPMLEPKYLIKIRQEKPAGFEMVFLFYCKQADKADMQFKINKLVYEFTKDNENLTLAFD
jgi:small-conductance mechanosensitive channel